MKGPRAPLLCCSTFEAVDKSPLETPMKERNAGLRQPGETSTAAPPIAWGSAFDIHSILKLFHLRYSDILSTYTR